MTGSRSTSARPTSARSVSGDGARDRRDGDDEACEPGQANAGRARVRRGMGRDRIAFDLGKTLNRQCVYLLIGIPITVVFQLVIRKRPLRELWVRSGPRLSFRSVLAPVTVVLMIVPVYLLVRDLADTNGAGFVGYDLVC